MTASLLRLGSDTSVARLFKTLDSQRVGRHLLEALADGLHVPAPTRHRLISRAGERARRAIDDSRRCGLTVLSLDDQEYPPLLKEIVDPPIVLWAKGDLSCLAHPSVAIVGSRAASPLSLSVASRLARDLAAAGLVIVSGMARGVDGAAHAGALEAGGRTVAVLGSGTDVVYPAEHAGLAARIAGAGVLVSEFPPGALPLPRHFPLRNRIISGLSRAVVVIEASERSGSLITARSALDQGRDVLAVPGGVISGRSRGCHALIKDGARLVETFEDVLEEIGWKESIEPPPNSRAKSLQISELEGTMAPGEPYSLDELAGRTGRSAPDLLAELGNLEVEGKVSRIAGGHFVRLD